MSRRVALALLCVVMAVAAHGARQPAVVAERPTVAYMVAMTQDSTPQWLDGPAVLMESLVQATASSEYPSDFVALVGERVSQSSKDALTAMGWRVLDKHLPFSVDDIQGQHLREKVRNSGCCGADEMLRLYAYTLTQYHRVVSMDMDTIMLRPVDELFEGDFSLLAVEDHSLAVKAWTDVQPPFNGGFWVVKPSKRVFTHLFAIFKEGDFRPGSGWGGTRIGYCYGGETVQGLLPYYYTHYAIQHNHGVSYRVIDHCLYNNMKDNTRCNDTPLTDIRVTHFTACQKPWICLTHISHAPSHNCFGVHGEWARLWHQASLRRLRPELSPDSRAAMVADMDDMQRRKAVCPQSGLQGYRLLADAGAA
eukprot:jgi/Tetstr1/434937/TSEL_023933.t1